MALQDYLKIFLKYLWISLLGALVFGIAGLAMNWYTQYIPLYSATATVLVGGDAATVNTDTFYIQLASQFSAAYADIATRTPVLQAVINNLRLDMTPNALSKFVTAAVVDKTQLIEITASSEDRQRAAAIANETARQLILITSPRVRNFVLLVESATPPNGPSFSFILIPIVAAVLGYLVVAGLCFLNEFMRDPVYSPSELSRRVGVPVLATVRPRRGWNKRMREGRLPRWRRVSDAPWWPLAQACEHEIALLGSNPHPKPQHVMVSSATPADRNEKALVATNLAAAWTRGGMRVALVDSDFDAPTLAKWFNVAGQPGLAELLAGQPDPDQVAAALHPTGVPGLSVLPAGQVKGSPYPSVTAQSFQQVLKALSECVDVVVVNAAPMLTGGEAGVMAKQVGGVLLAVKTGRTTIEAVTDTRDALSLAQSHLWGVVAL